MLLTLCVCLCVCDNLELIQHKIEEKNENLLKKIILFNLEYFPLVLISVFYLGSKSSVSFLKNSSSIEVKFIKEFSTLNLIKVIF